MAEHWCEALAPCSELAVRLPEDPEARNWVEKAKGMLYNEACSYMRASDIQGALRNLECIGEHDADYEDVAILIHLGDLHQEAIEDLSARAYDEAINKLLQIRSQDHECQPEAISDALFQAYMGRGLGHLDLAAGELKPAPSARPSEPGYDVTDEVLEDIRRGIHDFGLAVEERPTSQEAGSAGFLAEKALEGLGRYGERGWEEAIVALNEVHNREPAYLSGKAVAVLCDAYLRLGDYYYQNGDYMAALGEYQAMQRLEECDQELVHARKTSVVVHLTPTATPTSTATRTPTPTATATNTPRPTMTPRPTVTLTATATSTPKSQPTKGETKPTKPPPPPSSTPVPPTATPKPRSTWTSEPGQ